MKNKSTAFILLSMLALSLRAQPQNGTYTLTSVATGKRLDGNATNLYPFPPNDGDYQKWVIKQTGTTSGRKVYRLTSVATSMCLDYDGNVIYPRKPDDSRFQLWIIEASDCPNCYTLTNLPTGKRLDGNAESLYGFDRNNGDYQKWRIEAIVPSAATNTVANLELPATKSFATSTSATQKAVRFGEWSRWQGTLTGFGEFRWRLVANTAAADFPKFIEVEYEVKNKRKGTVKVNAGVVQCKDPQKTSQYSKEFTVPGEATETTKVKVLNCGTAEAPKVIKAFVAERVNID